MQWRVPSVCKIIDFFFSLDILRNILLNTKLLTVFFISRILTMKLHLSVILVLPAKNW